jgi:hypothetical protein
MKAATAAKTAAANQAAMQKLQAQQTADAQAAQTRANAATQAAAQAQIALNKKWNDQIQAAKTQAELTQLQAQARAAGATVDSTAVQTATDTITQALQAQQQAQRDAELKQQQQQYIQQANDSLKNLTTTDQLALAQKNATASGITLDPNIVKAANDRIAKATADAKAAADAAAAKQAQEQAAQKQAALNDQYTNQLGYAKTTDELNKILADAKAAGAVIPQDIVTQETATVKAADEAAAAAAAKPVASVVTTPVAPVNPVTAYNQAQSAFVTKLNAGTATQADIDAYTTAAKNVNIAPSQTLINRATTAMATAKQQADLQAQQAVKAAAVPVTTEAQTQAKRQAELQAAYDAQGPVAPTTTGAPVASGATYGGSQLTAPNAHAVDQQNIARLQASTNPNQAPYRTALAQLQASGQPFTYNDVISLGNNTSAAQSQAEASAFTNQAMADSANRNQDFTWDDFGKVLGVVAVAALGVAAVGALGEGALATEAASTAGGMAANGATAGEITSTLTAGGVAPEAAATIANTATGIATGTVDAGAVAASGGVTPEMIATANASADPIATLSSQAGWTPSAATTAATTAEATTGAVAPLTELNAAQTAELMKNIDPNMISSLAPTTTGTAGGTASSLFEGTSLNPITNGLTNLGISPTAYPILNGALTGLATGAGINALTGKPITGDSLLMGALGGGVAGGIGSVLPDFGGGTFGSALAGAATNVGATAVVNLATGQPITVGNLATAALTGGVVGAGIQIATDGAGNNTYQYDDGSSMTVNNKGNPVSVTDNTGANVPVAAVDSRTGEVKQLAPVEDRSIPVKPSDQTQASTQPVAPATVDVNNITQDQLNQVLSQNNPYLTSSEGTQVADAFTLEQQAQYKQLIAEGKTPAEAMDIVGAGQETEPVNPIAVNRPGQAEVPQFANSDLLTPNTQLATQAEIDAGQARFNEAANAWEIAPPPVPATPAPVSVVPTTTVAPAPVAPAPAAPANVATETNAPVAPVITEPVTSAPTAPAAPANVATETNAPVAPVITEPVTSAPTAPAAPANVATETNAPVDTIPEITITAPRPTTPAAPPVIVPPLTPVQTAPITPSEPIPEVKVPEQPAPEQPAPEQPVAPTEPVYPPVYVPPIDTSTPPTPFKPYGLGAGTPLVGVGLNPGYITNVPRYYNNPSPVAAQYYYGQHPYQPNPTVFDRVLYNTLPVAPAVPFGLQQMYDPRTQTIENLLRGVGQASAVAPYNIPRAPAV